MALDVVLAHRDARVLTGERETVRFFVEEQGVALAQLPATRYRTRAHPERDTLRHFVGDGPS